jgi:hypothetical protein
MTWLLSITHPLLDNVFVLLASDSKNPSQSGKDLGGFAARDVRRHTRWACDRREFVGRSTSIVDCGGAVALPGVTTLPR